MAALTPGFTGADLANLVNEAALVATRREARPTSRWTTSTWRWSGSWPAWRRRTGSSTRASGRWWRTTSWATRWWPPRCRAADPVHKISIIPRGIGALGYTIQRPTEDRYLMTREELEDKMAVLLGGRAAEHLSFGHLSTGAADDLGKASEIARSMVTRYGMGAKLGPVSYQSEPEGFLGPAIVTRRLYSEETAREIDLAVRELVDGAFRRARAVLERNRPVLVDGARELLARESLGGDDLSAILGRVSPRGRAGGGVSGSDSDQAPEACRTLATTSSLQGNLSA